MITHQCPECRSVLTHQEINDDEFINPKLKIFELIQIVGHGPTLFRILKLDKNIMTLEKA